MTFAGAGIPDQPFANDDGSRFPAVQFAVDQVLAGVEVDLVEALRGTRLLIPLVAVLDEGVAGIEKESHLATPYFAGRDRRRANIAFTAVASALAWDPATRVVPTPACAAAAAAIGDGAAALIIDPADRHVREIGLPALYRLAGAAAPLPNLADIIESSIGAMNLTYELTAGADGVPILCFHGVATADLPELAAVVGSDPRVADRCPVGMDFAVASR